MLNESATQQQIPVSKLSGYKIEKILFSSLFVDAKRNEKHLKTFNIVISFNNGVANVFFSVYRGVKLLITTNDSRKAIAAYDGIV